LGSPTTAEMARTTKPADEPKKNLFDSLGDFSEEDDEDGGAQLEEIPVLKVNKEFAKRFEHNKKREEKHRCEPAIFNSSDRSSDLQVVVEAKYGKDNTNGDVDGEGSSAESSEEESEDEDGKFWTDELDAQWSSTLQMIKNKDPRLSDPKFKAYPDADAPSQTDPKLQKEKAIFLRDYHREKYMAGDVGADEAEEQGGPVSMPYSQEQAALKQSVLAGISAAAADASDDEDGEDAFLRPKELPEADSNGIHPSRSGNVITKTQLSKAEQDELADNDPEKFLEWYMGSKAWISKNDGSSNWQELDDSGSEEGDLDLADEFEHAYNVRFEDPEKSNEVLKSYDRTMATIRSEREGKSKSRKRRRERDKEQKQTEKAERKEERARLRQLKVEEAHDKLRKIKKAAGMSGKTIQQDEWAKLLDDAWDDDRWEEEMAKKFGDDYYAANEEDESGSDEEQDGGRRKKKRLKKPKWDDDIEIGDIIPTFDDADPHITLTESEAGDAVSDVEGRPSKKRKSTADHKAAKRLAKLEHAKITELVDTRIDADAAFSTTAADILHLKPFAYREVDAVSFGMTAADILMAPSDAVLNEFAGLKKLAQHRDPKKKAQDAKRLGKKQRLRQWRRENFGKDFERTGPEWRFGGDRRPGEDEAAEGVNIIDVEKKKRKRSKGKGKGKGKAKEIE
jgi:protein KRI1